MFHTALYERIADTFYELGRLNDAEHWTHEMLQMQGDVPWLLRRLDEVFKEPIAGIRDTVPVTAGGLGAANVGKNIAAFGYDVAPLAGSNVLDHPMGPKAGAIAMNQAVEAYNQEEITEPDELKEYATRKGYKELLAIL